MAPACARSIGVLPPELPAQLVALQSRQRFPISRGLLQAFGRLPQGRRHRWRQVLCADTRQPLRRLGLHKLHQQLVHREPPFPLQQVQITAGINRVTHHRFSLEAFRQRRHQLGFHQGVGVEPAAGRLQQQPCGGLQGLQGEREAIDPLVAQLHQLAFTQPAVASLAGQGAGGGQQVHRQAAELRDHPFTHLLRHRLTGDAFEYRQGRRGIQPLQPLGPPHLHQRRPPVPRGGAEQHMGLASGGEEGLHLPFVAGVVEQQQHLLLRQVLEHLTRLLLQGALQPRHLPALPTEAGELRRQVQAAIDPVAAGGIAGFMAPAVFPEQLALAHPRFAMHHQPAVVARLAQAGIQLRQLLLPAHHTHPLGRRCDRGEDPLALGFAGGVDVVDRLGVGDGGRCVVLITSQLIPLHQVAADRFVVKHRTGRCQHQISPGAGLLEGLVVVAAHRLAGDWRPWRRRQGFRCW